MMTRGEVYVTVAKTALSHLPPGEDSVLACMVALHTHDIVLEDLCELTDMRTSSEGAPRKLHAVTRRHAAEIVAAATGNESNREMIDYWYGRYSSRSPCEVIQDVPQPLLGQVLEVVAAMKASPIVRDFVEAE
jgi:hypothetical protein